jgi:hypothetical protein
MLLVSVVLVLVCLQLSSMCSLLYLSRFKSVYVVIKNYLVMSARHKEICTKVNIENFTIIHCRCLFFTSQLFVEGKGTLLKR